MAYSDFAILISEVANSGAGQIVEISHPDASGEIHQLPNGSNARVVAGPAAYQLSSGEKILL